MSNKKLPEINPDQHPKDDKRWSYFMAGWELGMQDAKRTSIRWLTDYVLTEWEPDEIRRTLAEHLDFIAEVGHPSYFSEHDYENLRALEYIVEKNFRNA